MSAITRKALDILAEIDEPLEKLHRQTLGHMTAEELSSLSRLLEKAAIRIFCAEA